MTISEMRDWIAIHEREIAKADRKLKELSEEASVCRTAIRERRRKLAELRNAIAAAEKKGEGDD